MHVIRFISFIFALYIGSKSLCAQEYMQSIQKCIATSTTQEGNDQIARWVFSTLSLNPVLHSVYEIPAEKMMDIRQRANDVFISLLTKNCRGEIVEAARLNHKDAIHNALVYMIRISFKRLTDDPRISDGINSASILMAQSDDFKNLLKEFTGEKNTDLRTR